MSSKVNAAVSEVWWPVFLSLRYTEKPGVLVSTMNMLMPAPRCV
jgi:hypothetical protein